MKKNTSLSGRSQTAFSLVEVVVSLGIVSFALLAIVALLPIGLQSTKDTIEETNAVNVLSAIIADRRATPFDQSSKIYKLPALTTAMASPFSDYFGVTDTNTAPIAAHDLTGTHYRVDYTVTAPATLGGGTMVLNDPYQIYFKVSWPALNTPNVSPAGAIEVIATFPQP